MARLVAAAVMLVCSAGAADKDNWVRVSSPHFELFTDAGERVGRDVVRHFEQVHSFFEQRFQHGIDLRRKAQVLLFRGEKEYEPYRPNASAAAFFHPGEYHDFIVMHTALNDWRPMAVHELTHLMVHQLTQELPLWLSEGLAELYSNMEPRGSQVLVGRDIPARMRVLAEGGWVDLRTLMAVDHESAIYNEKPGSAVFYAESWKLVHMLHLHPAYQAHFADLVRALGEMEGAAAFQRVYGKDLAAVEKDLRSYLTGDTINALLFNIQLPKSVDAPELTTGASLSARLVIGEMLSNARGRSAQAMALYAALAKEYPARWEVAESQGRFAWHERRLEDASRHFARAEELGCKDGGMFLLWGRVLGYANHPTEAVAALAKANELLPDTEVQLEYGNALVRNGNWGAAAGVLRGVKAVPPANAWRYGYNLAYSLYKLGDAAGSRRALETARQYAANDRERQPLEQLETALGRMAPKREAVLASVEGTLEQIECGQVARLHVRTGSGMKVFVSPDLRAISGELECGAQRKPLTVRVQYQALPSASGEVGLLRSLEFR
jgi:Flp pilus assembly protein TadD